MRGSSTPQPRERETARLTQEHTVRAAMEGEVGVRELGNVAHGAASTGRSKSLGKLLRAVAMAAEWHAHGFGGQNFANTAWAFAATGQSDPSLFRALARAGEQRMSDFNARDLANATWAFAAVG